MRRIILAGICALLGLTFCLAYVGRSFALPPSRCVGVEQCNPSSIAAYRKCTTDSQCTQSFIDSGKQSTPATTAAVKGKSSRAKALTSSVSTLTSNESSNTPGSATTTTGSGSSSSSSASCATNSDCPAQECMQAYCDNGSCFARYTTGGEECGPLNLDGTRAGRCNDCGGCIIGTPTAVTPIPSVTPSVACPDATPYGCEAGQVAISCKGEGGCTAQCPENSVILGWSCGTESAEVSSDQRSGSCQPVASSSSSSEESPELSSSSSSSLSSEGDGAGLSCVSGSGCCSAPVLEPTNTVTATATPTQTSEATPTRGVVATATPTSAVVLSPTPTPSLTATIAASPTTTARSTATPTGTPTATPGNTGTRTATPTATSAVSGTALSTPTISGTATVSTTIVPTETPHTPLPSISLTGTPVVTATPTVASGPQLVPPVCEAEYIHLNSRDHVKLRTAAGAINPACESGCASTCAESSHQVIGDSGTLVTKKGWAQIRIDSYDVLKAHLVPVVDSQGDCVCVCYDDRRCNTCNTNWLGYNQTSSEGDVVDLCRPIKDQNECMHRAVKLGEPPSEESGVAPESMPMSDCAWLTSPRNGGCYTAETRCRSRYSDGVSLPYAEGWAEFLPLTDGTSICRMEISDGAYPGSTSSNGQNLSGNRYLNGPQLPLRMTAANGAILDKIKKGVPLDSNERANSITVSLSQLPPMTVDFSGEKLREMRVFLDAAQTTIISAAECSPVGCMYAVGEDFEISSPRPAGAEPAKMTTFVPNSLTYDFEENYKILRLKKDQVVANLNDWPVSPFDKVDIRFKVKSCASEVPETFPGSAEIVIQSCTSESCTDEVIGGGEAYRTTNDVVDPQDNRIMYEYKWVLGDRQTYWLNGNPEESFAKLRKALLLHQPIFIKVTDYGRRVLRLQMPMTGCVAIRGSKSAPNRISYIQAKSAGFSSVDMFTRAQELASSIHEAEPLKELRNYFAEYLDLGIPDDTDWKFISGTDRKFFSLASLDSGIAPSSLCSAIATTPILENRRTFSGYAFYNHQFAHGVVLVDSSVNLGGWKTIVLHELGHAMFDLLDEYLLAKDSDATNLGYGGPQCSISPSLEWVLNGVNYGNIDKDEMQGCGYNFVAGILRGNIPLYRSTENSIMNNDSRVDGLDFNEVQCALIYRQVKKTGSYKDYLAKCATLDVNHPVRPPTK